MSSALDKALAAIGLATSLVSELDAAPAPDHECEPPHKKGGDAGEPPRGTDQLRGLLAQLNGASVRALLAARLDAVDEAGEAAASASGGESDDELVMTELDPAEMEAALALRAREREHADARQASESDDDEPLESTPVAVGAADIEALKRVNRGRPSVPKAPARPETVGIEHVVYDVDVVAFLAGGYRAFAHLVDTSKRRDLGARRSALAAERSALALDVRADAETRSTAAAPLYSPLRRATTPPATLRRLDVARASPAKFRALKRGPAALGGFLGAGAAGATARDAFRLASFAEMLGVDRAVALRLPEALQRRRAPVPDYRAATTVAGALAFADGRRPETTAVAGGAFAAWLAGGHDEAAAAEVDLAASAAGVALEAPLAVLARNLGLAPQPRAAGAMRAVWASPTHAEPWSVAPVDRVVAVLRGPVRAVLVPPRAAAPDVFDLNGEPRGGALWPDAAAPRHALKVAVDPGDALFVPAAWASRFEPLVALAGETRPDHVLLVTTYWKTACRDLAPYVPVDVLGAPDDAVPLGAP